MICAPHHLPTGDRAMNNQLPPICGVIWFIGFVLMWWIVVHLLAEMSGWYDLAEKFRTTDSPLQWMWLEYLGMGMVRYGGICRYGFAHQGLFLGVIFPFNFGSPRLFIPKSEIKFVKIEKILWYEYYYFEFNSFPHIKIRL